MKKRGIILAAPFILAVPAVAWANVGTPLMWAGMVHLTLGNLFVGVLEGAILAKVFALSYKRCIGFLILANYFSAWLGALFIVGHLAPSLPIGLDNAWPLFWLLVAITYASTLVLEFPLVALAFRGEAAWGRKALRGSLLVQTVSYVLLFGWYGLASGVSLWMKTDIVGLSSMSLSKQVRVYFISSEDGDAYSGLLADAKWKYLFDLNSTSPHDRLFVHPSSPDPELWSLAARLEANNGVPKFITIQRQLALITASSSPEMNNNLPPNEATWRYWGVVPKLGDAKSSSWEFESGFWPGEGLRGIETKSGKRVRFSIETPFIVWMIRNATHLPGDKVLLQLGDDQICVYDPDKNQIALVARGRGPVAVLEKGEAKKIIDGVEQ